jgi:hypothetical protein
MDWVIDIDSLNNGCRLSESQVSMCFNPDNNIEALYEERGNISAGMMNDIPNGMRPVNG